MAADLFETAALELEQRTDFDKLEARGTLRLALKAAGLNAKSLTLHELEVVFDKLMPDELEKRGIDHSEEVCASVMEAVSQQFGAKTGVSSDEIFSRLGGDD